VFAAMFSHVLPVKDKRIHNLTADISDIFSSIQGEGPYMGTKQIFIRFAGCNMNCVYCDENILVKSNKLTAAGILEKINNLIKLKGPHNSVSITGGEPLCSVDFLKVLLPELKQKGLSVYLETNGTLPDALKNIIEYVDIIAMDIKMPSSTKDSEFWNEHMEFLRAARSKRIFIKAVITGETDFDEVKRTVDLIYRIDPSIEFIFQPATESIGIDLAALKKIRHEFMDYALTKLQKVRIIPQMHKIWGIQ
jgi:organic radical activating enzyme